MKTPGFTLRLLTLLVYFLPFVFFFSTCTDLLTLDQAYNKTEALANEEKKHAYELAVFESLLDSIGRDNNIKSNSDELRARIKIHFGSSQHLKYLDQDFRYYLIMPTPYALSGMGAIYFHKHLLGRITIAISFVLSLLSLLLWRFFVRKGAGRAILLSNLAVLIIFIIVSVYGDVTLLFGTWVLFLLLIAQILAKDTVKEAA